MSIIQIHLRALWALFVLVTINCVLLSSNSKADEYVLIMSKNDELCRYMQQLYNADLKKYGKFEYRKHKEFNWVKWTDKIITLRPASDQTSTMDISARISVFDINNDSKKEVILYSPSMLSNLDIDSYDVFEYDVLRMLKESDTVDGDILYKRRMRSFLSSDGIPVNVYDISDENIIKLPQLMQSSIRHTKERGDKIEYFVGWDHRIDFIKIKDKYFIAFDGYPSIGPKQNYDEVGRYCLLSEYQQDNTLSCQCIYLIKGKKPKRKGSFAEDRPSLPKPRYLE